VVQYKHKMIKDLVYVIADYKDDRVMLRESGTDREFWITVTDLSNNYEKK
jgi:hypothetical protein